MKKFIWLPLVLVLALSACKNRKSDGKDNPPTTDTTASNPPSTDPSCKALAIGENGPMDAINSARASISDDCLHFKIVHGGGCKEHEFKLLWDGAFMESMPPQVNLSLSHNSNEDHCRSLVNVEESFDISKLKYGGLEQVILNISLPGREGKSLTATYDYKP